MNAFWTVIPIILIRYGLLNVVNKEALKRASFFAPLVGKEKIAFWVYQMTTAFMVIYLLVLKIKTGSEWFYIGLIVYGLGLILYAVSIVNYAKPKMNGINLKGLYKVSRNPMYVAFFIYFLGCVFLTGSWVLLGILISFQISVHWIILSEERWCIKEFGEEYINYMNKVRRYI
ncbi:protein-S-isoprenylcysteine O-methyltransferase Ste14 [Natranaerovirga hydrolytica]|uniref:Protein-S-isoprenylcysteine O-methyltransferase Ste14 n=1 Tax=Natranaerovirga hydrolytica TaxID=680378 RepID=A0A4R1MJ18_9FIRM|nr:isoprenylcysteine carboxylmethyltransferase family protein [Natranaerovirga hydrolytica]TCK92676.1 protein-S-isoprenylcysteine O-methyltransferase Ste14 [Natranaerovirga hydrolytica]